VNSYQLHRDCESSENTVTAIKSWMAAVQSVLLHQSINYCIKTNSSDECYQLMTTVVCCQHL